MFDDLVFRLRSLFRRNVVEAELEEELRTHFDREVEKYLRAGLSPAESKRRARLAIGGLEQVKEDCRDARGVSFFETLLQDVRFALRMLRKNPGFTAVAVLTLALGIGANTAIFSVVDTVLLRPLPFRDPDRLVKVIFSYPGLGLRNISFSIPELEDLRSRAKVFDEVSVVWAASVNLTGSRVPQRLELLAVSPNYFTMLGATPQLGRLFDSQDFALGFAPAAVISDGLWRRAFGTDPNVLGRSLQLDNDPYIIVGVLPPGFRHPGKTIAADVEIWATAGFSADPFAKPARNARQMPGAIGRLKAGLGQGEAQARLTSLSEALRNEFPNDYPPVGKWSIEIQSLQESLVGGVRSTLLVLLGAVILIILVASVNIANLLLARASTRYREMAVRSALGASRMRLVRQTLTESVILALIAGLAGVLTARAVLRIILQFVPSNIPRLHEVSVNWSVLGFALLISVLTGLLFGLAPAIQSAKADLVAAFREGTCRAGHSVKVSRLRGVLIVSELALAMVLMVGAGLLLRTFWGLLQQNPGFNPSGVVAASLWLPAPNDPKADTYAKSEQLTPFFREVLRRLRAIPGVELAAFTTSLPATGDLTFNVALNIEDRAVDSSQDLKADLISVTPDYFRVIQSSLVRGRFFAENDEKGQQDVAIIDESTARRYWPGRDPIGRRLKTGRAAAAPWLTVVGVVGDIKHDGLDKDGVPHLYVAAYQRASKILNVVTRTSLPAASLESQIRSAIQSVDPGLPVFNVRSMPEIIGDSLATRRFSAELVAAFAVLALALTSVGIYGLLAYLCGQRSREIGIRMALGAQPGDILRMILKQGAQLAGGGILAGLLFAAVTAPLISALLYGVRPLDPIVFLAVPLVLLAVSLLASYIPARRAMRVDPMIALRHE
jgi:predicted permease